MKLKTLLQEFVSLDKVTSYDQIKDITDIIDVKGVVNLINRLPAGVKELGVTFGRVEGSFFCSNIGLDTCKGFPKHVGGLMEISHNTFKNLEYISAYISGDLEIVFNKCPLSLLGVNKHIKVMKARINLSHTPISEGGLGLLWIDGLLNLQDLSLGLYDREFEPAAIIINKYLTLAGGKDAWKYIEYCRDELEAAGLHRFAKE